MKFKKKSFIREKTIYEIVKKKSFTGKKPFMEL